MPPGPDWTTYTFDDGSAVQECVFLRAQRVSLRHTAAGIPQGGGGVCGGGGEVSVSLHIHIHTHYIHTHIHGRGHLNHFLRMRPRYLSKEVVVQEKDASEAQEEDGMDLGQRKVCPWGMLARVSNNLSLSLFLSLSLSRAAVAHSLTMHRLAHNRPHPHPTSPQHSCNVQACRAS